MDVPVPKGVVPTGSGMGFETDEVTKLRYSAATCDPDDFMRRKFTLRQYLWGRKTELFVSALSFSGLQGSMLNDSDRHDNVQ